MLQAYGWGDLAVETQDGKKQESRQEQARKELLTRLVALNHERAAEEKRGLIRYLRPDYQNPTKASDGRGSANAERRPPLQADLAGTESPSTESPSTDLPKHRSTETPAQWPDRLPEQVAILRKLIATGDRNVAAPDAESLSTLFGRKNKKRSEQIEGILETLKGLGQLLKVNRPETQSTP